jgi:predicted membrane protein
MNENATNENAPGPGSPIHASFGAIVLIALGAILFLDNLGLLPFANIRAYWPMAIAVFGALQLTRSRSACSMVWPWTMIAIGVLLTLGNLGILRVTIGSLWPVFLIAAGVSMLVRRTSWTVPRNWARQWPDRVHMGSRVRGSFRNLDANAVFSSVNRRIDDVNFERADLNCFFGELKVDLRGATIAAPNREAVVDTNAAFGAIKLRVPETWRVVVHGSAVFGAYEDKTVPPRPGPGIDPPTLIISGNAAFGAVEIEN